MKELQAKDIHLIIRFISPKRVYRLLSDFNAEIINISDEADEYINDVIKKIREKD